MAIDKLLKNKHNNCLIVQVKAKLQKLKQCKKMLFRHLQYWVTFYAIWQI